MKRSEMIQLITKVMEENFEVDNGSAEADAEKILNAIENVGMVAPPVPAKVIHGAEFRFGGGCSSRCNCDECNPNFLMHKWEKE